MDIFDRANLKALLADHPSPCVSIFMPTHRLVDPQDPIRFKVRLGEAEEQLTAAGLRGPEVKDLLKPARALLEDSGFWHNQSDGLAFFLAPPFVRVYRLPIAFPDLVVVGDGFHVKPLLPLLGDAFRYYVLALSQNGVRLLQGTPHTVSEVDLKGVPRSLAEAMLNHDVDEMLNFHTQPALGFGRGSAMFHGHGVGIDDAKDDLLRFFQQIDRGLHPVLREQRAPLVLAAVEYLMPIYHKANTYPNLLDKGINGNPDHLDNQRLHDLAWAIVQPVFQKARQNASAHYEQLAGTGRTANDLGEVVHAAHVGQIESLFIPADRDRWGTFDPTTGLTTIHAKQEPGDQDLLNLAAVRTLLHGGAVYLVPADDIPGHGMMAATYWQPHTRKVLV